MEGKIDYTEVINLLQRLISIPSFSREEEKTAEAIVKYLDAQGVMISRAGNNVWATNKYFDPEK